MQRKYFSSAQLPKFHDAMLIVKVRRDAAQVAGPAVAAARMGTMSVKSTSVAGRVSEVALLPAVRAVESFSTAGLGMLQQMERGGMIRRITSLAPSSRAAAAATEGRGPSAMIAMSARSFRSKSKAAIANAGVNIVELQREDETVQLQKALAQDPNVEFVSRVPIRYLLASRKARPRRAAPPASTMWNLAKIEWAQARAARGFQDANNVNVAVLDTGVDADHPDLDIAKYTFLHPDTPSISGRKDIIGHGTHVAGTIGAAINNRRGINGICRCRLSAWKIFPDETEFAGEDEGFGYFVDPVMYRRALADCIDEGIDVVNLSIGGPGEPDPQEAALFAELIDGGTTVVAAMGNERGDGSPTSYPAAIPGVIAVGATTINDRVTQFSNRGDHISVCAPGKGIWSTLPTYPGQFGFEAVPAPGGKFIEGKPLERETDYDSWDGTSMASPHVAAAIALLIAKVGRVGPVELRRLLVARSDAVPGMQGRPFDSDYGYGRLNLSRLLG